MGLGIKSSVVGLISMFVLFCLAPPAVSGTNCKFATYFRGNWFSVEGRADVRTLVTQEKWGTLDCKKAIYETRRPLAIGQNATFLLADPAIPECLYCQHVLWRTPNVLQIKREAICNQPSYDFTQECVPRLPSIYDVTTYFRRRDEQFVECPDTIPSAFYNFTYEMRNSAGGVCNNSLNLIGACNNDGFLIHVRPTFYMAFNKCSGVPNTYNKKLRFQCFGSWIATNGFDVYKFSAIRDTVEKELRRSFFCLMAMKSEVDQGGSFHWLMNEASDCSSFNSDHDNSTRLVVTKYSSCN